MILLSTSQLVDFRPSFWPRLFSRKAVSSLCSDLPVSPLQCTVHQTQSYNCYITLEYFSIPSRFKQRQAKSEDEGRMLTRAFGLHLVSAATLLAIVMIAMGVGEIAGLQLLRRLQGLVPNNLPVQTVLSKQPLLFLTTRKYSLLCC